MARPWPGAVKTRFGCGDVVSGQVKTSFESARGVVFSLSFSPDGTTLAGGGEMGAGDGANRVWLWDVVSGRVKASLEHSKPFYSMSFSPDGMTIATAGGSWSISTASGAGGSSTGGQNGWAVGCGQRPEKGHPHRPYERCQFGVVFARGTHTGQWQ